MQEKLKLPDLELQILNHIWDLKNRATVQQILDNWKETKIPLYTTILKKLQVMEAKGLVRHEKAGKAYQYIPLLSREEVSRNKIQSLLKTIFAGNKLELIHTFLDHTQWDTDEIGAIRRMLAVKEKEVQE